MAVLRSLIPQSWSGPPFAARPSRPSGRPSGHATAHHCVAPWYALLVSLTVPDPRPHRQRSAERLGANPRARLGLLAHFLRRPLQDTWTVREVCSPRYSHSLSRIRPELAMMCLYRVLV